MRSAECGVFGGGIQGQAAFHANSALRTPHSGGSVIDLSGKRAFVTGGGRGIGRATALLLARAGASVAVGYRSRKADADGTIKAVGGGKGRKETVAVQADLGDPGGAKRAVEEAARALGGLDILVVNHGVWPPDDVPLAAMSDAQWEGTRRANLDSMFYVCRAAIPRLAAGEAGNRANDPAGTGRHP